MDKVQLNQLSDLLPEEILSLNFIVFMEHGSKLYGTDTPESDTDFKGVYLPSKKQILLNRIPKSVSFRTKSDKKDERNGKDDIDCQVYSLHYFIELATKGETVALDMLHALEDWPLRSSDIWRTIQRQKGLFYTKNLKSFVGYARKQAAKYGLKGSRLDAGKAVVDFMAEELSLAKSRKFFDDQTIKSDDLKLSDVWDRLPEGDHLHKLAKGEKGYNDLRMYQVCGKNFQETAKLVYILPILQKFRDDYGYRAKQASENKGVDWKAMSHAIRAAMQVLSILNYGDIYYPLKGAPFLKEVKLGTYDFKTQVMPMLEAYMEHVEKASEVSNLPETVDKGRIDKFLTHILKATVFKDTPDDETPI